VEKDFDRMNYYEMLDIERHATAAQIRTAYNAALQMYQPDSMVSYSFFSRDEREKILTQLDKAYFTLINEAQRTRYDGELDPSAISESGDKIAAVKKPVNIFEINRQQLNSPARKIHNAELKAKIAQSPLIQDIMARQEISGADLKAMRNELSVPIEKIHQETKIRLDYLHDIEEDKTGKLPAAVFLKGFIRAYLKSLCIEPADEISVRYIDALQRKN
jgi:DnaJ-class molecular chaperone